MTIAIRIVVLEQQGNQHVCEVVELERDEKRRKPDVVLTKLTITVPVDAPTAYIVSQARKAIREHHETATRDIRS